MQTHIILKMCSLDQLDHGYLSCFFCFFNLAMIIASATMTMIRGTPIPSPTATPTLAAINKFNTNDWLIFILSSLDKTHCRPILLFTKDLVFFRGVSSRRLIPNSNFHKTIFATQRRLGRDNLLNIVVGPSFNSSRYRMFIHENVHEPCQIAYYRFVNWSLLLCYNSLDVYVNSGVEFDVIAAGAVSDETPLL